MKLYKTRIIVFLFGCFLLLPAAFAKNTLNFAFKGVQDEMLANVQSRFAIELKAYDTLTEQAINHLMQQAPADIQQALQPFGYFKPTIRSHLRHQGNNWLASFNISLGTPVRIRNISLEVTGDGKTNSELQQAINHFPLKKGAVFQTQEYDKAKQNLLLLVTNQGYVKSHFTESKVFINVETHSADIVLKLETEQRYFFGPVTFADSPYDTSLLKRFVHFKEREPYSAKKIIALQQNMGSSFYFRRVNIVPDFKHAENNTVPVHVSVEAQKSQKYNIGVGYGTFTGPRLTAGASFRRVTSTGQHLDLQLRLSPVLSGLAAKYYIPGANPLNDRWIIGTGYQRFMPKSGSSYSNTLSVGYTKKIHKFRTSTALNYLHERYTVQSDPTQTNNLLYPSMTFSYLNTDSVVNPTFGKFWSVTLQGASEKAYSSTTFFQSDIKGKYIFKPFSFGRIALRGELGYTAVSNLNNLPLTMRFFAGGSNSIRGYRDSSIGPGKYLQVGSIEYQNHIKGNWSVATFYDFGNASNDFNTQYQKGVGVGLVYQSLVGPIKLYAANAISKPGQPWGVEFSIGPEF